MGNTFYLTRRDDPRDRIQIEVGDSKQQEFYPQSKIMRWDNEVNCSLRLLHNEKEPKISQAGNKILWQAKDIEAHFYETDNLPEGAHEIEIILNKKPKTNKIEFSLNTKGARFLYQSLDFAEQEKSDSARPENVKGSYAVYASEKKTNYVNGKIYRTGKIGHIYRPRIMDSAGHEVWGMLHISDNTLCVTIPREFIETAVYPIRHAAGLTFGYTTTPTGGSTAVTDNRAGIGSVYQHTAANGDTVTMFTAYMSSTGGTGTYDFAAYTFAGGVPVTRLATPVTVTAPATAAWTNSLTVSQLMSNGVTYVPAFGHYSGTIVMWWDSGTGSQRSNDTTAGGLPTTWTSAGTSSSEYGIYATYITNTYTSPQVNINGTWYYVNQAYVYASGQWNQCQDCQTFVGFWQ
jgi:WXXGXW repeat (2 copies)